MPTYDWMCETCRTPLEKFSFIYPPVPPECCGNDMTRQLSTGGEFIMKSLTPSKAFKREKEDNYIRSVSKRARELKQTGQVKMEDHLTFKDVDKLNPE